MTMKKKSLLSTVLAIVFALSLNATIWTVSNLPDSPGQFTSIQAAIDAATNGDTIYVSGSPISYESITINKEIHLFGAGYNPDKQQPNPSTIDYITMDTITGISGASNTSIQGFIFSSFSNNYSTYHKVHNVLLRRNLINGYLYVSQSNNLLIVNNIITGYLQNTTYEYNAATNLIITNNIITSSTPLNSFSGSNSLTVLISNNLFIRSDVSAIASGDVKKVLFANNIFYGVPILSQYGVFQYCIWNNNISYYSGHTTFPVTVSNSGANNLEGVNPMFVLDYDYNFDYTDDYHLQAGSPGENAGTDGTDIGIYGGPYPFPDGGVSGSGYQTSQETPIPQIYEMNGQNSAIPLNGTFQVAVKAHIQQ